MAAAVPIELDAEYRLLREEAGFVRRPSLRALEVRGGDAIEFLDSQLTNDIASLEPGGGCYAALLDRKGHLQSDLTVAVLDPERIWLLAEAEGAERLAAHLGMYRIGREVEVEGLDLELISVIGPEARATLDLEALGPEHSHGPAVIAGVATVRALVTAPGVDLAVAPARAEELAAALTAAGIPEASERAAEILRVEAGRPRLGPEMGTETMPAEAGIVEQAVSFTKGCYIGQETVARLHYKGRPNRHLRGLRLEREARPGDAVQLDGRELGRIGTAALSPARGPVALAILRREAAPGSRVAVGEEGNAGEVVELPFGSA